MIDFSNENILHVRANDEIEYIQFRKLLEYNDKIRHCYTIKPQDFRNKTKDSAECQNISKILGIKSESINMPIQTHTNIVKVAEKNCSSKDFQDVDGLITGEIEKTLLTVTADCTAFILYDPVKNVIGNIHSGWKGTVNKIGKVAIEELSKKYGSRPEDIICCICPTIRQCHFEVEDDVKDLFIKAFEDESIIKMGEIKDGKQKYFIDTVAANKKMFINCGLQPENIIDSGICTLCYHNKFHSYRYAGKDAGRSGAIIGLI